MHVFFVSDLGCLIGRNGGTEWNRCIVTVTVSYSQAHGLRSPWASPTCFPTISGVRSPSDVHLMWLANKTLLLRDMLVTRCKVGDCSDKTKGGYMGHCRCVRIEHQKFCQSTLSKDGWILFWSRTSSKQDVDISFSFEDAHHGPGSAECFLCLKSARSSTSTQHWVWRWLRQSEAGPTSWSTGQRCGDWCAMSWWQSRTAGHLLHDPPIRPAAMRDFRWVSYSSFIAFLDLRIFDHFIDSI